MLIFHFFPYLSILIGVLSGPSATQWGNEMKGCAKHDGGGQAEDNAAMEEGSTY